MTRRQRILHRLTWLDWFRVVLIVAAAALAATVAALAFWVSFEAISAYVVRIGALPQGLRYAGPLLVDSFTVLATVFLLWLALSGKPLWKQWDSYYAWALIIGATGASAALNAAHVAAKSPTEARWVAGAVPVTLLASVHLLVLLLLRLLAWTPTPKPIRETAGVGEQEREAGPTTTPPAPAANSPRVRPHGEAPAPGGSKPAAAPARSGAAPTAPERVTKSTDPWPERARLIREHLAEDLNRSTRQIEAALRSTAVGPGERGRFGELVKQLRSEMTRESNGAPERIEVLS